MRAEDDRREWYRRRITDRQRTATELSITLKLDAEDLDDIAALAEAADILEIAVEELEKARRVLVGA